MDEITLDTVVEPKIVVEAQDRLYIRGWDRQAFRAAGPKDSVHVEQKGETIRVTASSRLELRVPAAATLEVTGFGDMSIRDMTGDVRVLNAGDGLTLRDVADARVGTVEQDLNVRTVNGDLNVENVGRFANIRTVHGDFTLDHVDAHLNIREVSGSITANAGGNANIYVDLQDEHTVRVTAAGVITCRVYPALNAKVKVTTSGPVNVKIGEQRETKQDDYEGVFGEGAGELILEGSGPVTLAEIGRERETPAYDFDFSIAEELSGIGAGIGEQITAQLGMIEEELEARMTGFSDLVENWDLPADKLERIRRRTQEKVERAQEKIRRAQETASSKIADAQRRAEKEARRAADIERRVKGKSVSIDLGSFRKSDRPKADPVSDQERLLILKMVAEKKITLEEAESLLSALEGK